MSACSRTGAKEYGQSAFVLSLMSLFGVEKTTLVEGAVDTICFNVFCQEFLRPCLKAGDVVVLDNLGAHKASQIEVIAKECKVRVVWLPPYSPDFSPFEQM